MFRCSSNGESGIVGPTGVVKARTYTGHDPMAPALYQLPIVTQTNTFYVAIGFIFEWICLIVAVGFYVLIVAPKSSIDEMFGKLKYIF